MKKMFDSEKERNNKVLLKCVFENKINDCEFSNHCKFYAVALIFSAQTSLKQGTLFEFVDVNADFVNAFPLHSQAYMDHRNSFHTFSLNFFFMLTALLETRI